MRVQLYAQNFNRVGCLGPPITFPISQSKNGKSPSMHFHMLRVESFCIVAPFLFEDTNTHHTQRKTGFGSPNLTNTTVSHIHCLLFTDQTRVGISVGQSNLSNIIGLCVPALALPTPLTYNYHHPKLWPYQPHFQFSLLHLQETQIRVV